MLYLPFKFLHAVEVRWSLALMVAPDCLSAGIAEIVTTSAGHMGASLCFLNYLPAFVALPVLFGHLPLNCHLHLTFPFVRNPEAVFAVFG